MSKEMSGAFAFLLGVGAGVLVGILFAPKSGAETRSDIQGSLESVKDGVDRIYEKGKEKTSEIVTKGSEVFSKGKQKVHDLAETFGDKS